ncbi:AmpG family muropeptide MFS transporter [Methylobacterium flocculans]|uniref:AmpG family muropeptide MFS transporter n=1 Tax=Methylobacterium flocculans TaxID=2984843 RepID=UPI0021F334B5|nr:AmpG family muropeptide MFS transporter [Methylobacterium sp. FF17]
MPPSTVRDTPSRLRLKDIVEDPRILLMLALGFSSGLPLLLVLGTFSTRLAYSEVDIKSIGLFSYLALPYTLKFLWAPLIDRFDVPALGRLLGRRRAWMIATQCAVAVALSLMALADPGSSLALLGLGAFLVAICAATQDVVIDGWRIDAAGTDLQGVMAATSNLGYRLALMSAGAGALFIASAYGWSVAYFSMAALMGVGILAALFAPAYDRTSETASGPGRAAPKPVWTFKSAILEPLTELHTRLGRSLWAILILVAFYRMPDFISGVMASPLYKTVGFSLVDIGFVSKLYGIWVGIAGAFVGGWAMTRFGLFPTLVVGAFLGAASNLSFSWLSFGGPEVWRLTAAISIDNFCGSFAGMALIAYMSSLTAPGLAATQYALFSSLYALPGKFVAGTSGYIVAAFGYPVFFALTAAVGIPVVILCAFVGRAGERNAARASNAAAADPMRPEAAAGDEVAGNHRPGPELASTARETSATGQTGRPHPAHG